MMRAFGTADFADERRWDDCSTLSVLPVSSVVIRCPFHHRGHPGHREEVRVGPSCICGDLRHLWFAPRRKRLRQSATLRSATLCRRRLLLLSEAVLVIGIDPDFEFDPDPEWRMRNLAKGDRYASLSVMSTITAILQPDADGTVHVPVPEELRHCKIRITAVMEPAPHDAPRAKAGAWSDRGGFWMAPDFDEPMDDFLEYMDKE